MQTMTVKPSNQLNDNLNNSHNKASNIDLKVIPIELGSDYTHAN